jgi:hypothetical protein
LLSAIKNIYQCWEILRGQISASTEIKVKDKGELVDCPDPFDHYLIRRLEK